MSAAIANSLRIRSIWAPPLHPPGLSRPRGMHSPMSMSSSTRYWRNSRRWRAPGRPTPGRRRHSPEQRCARRLWRSGMYASAACNGAPLVTRHWSAVRHPVQHPLHAVCALDPARAVAPAAQPPDPGLTAGLRRQTRTHDCHHRQPLVSIGADLLYARLRWR
jgi:hypothetical protein